MTDAEIKLQLETEIAEITLALTHIRKGGQSYEITSGSGVGTKRVVTMADYATLSADRDKLNAELALYTTGSSRGVRVSAGW